MTAQIIPLPRRWCVEWDQGEDHMIWEGVADSSTEALLQASVWMFQNKFSGRVRGLQVYQI